jgi:hypothetical protein
MSADGHNETRPPGDPVRNRSLLQVGELIAIVSKRPDGASFALGLLVVAVGVISKIGRFEVVPRTSARVTLFVGGSLMVLGLLLMALMAAYRRQLKAHLPLPFQDEPPAVLFDPEFLLKVFVRGMPPAFIKEYPLNPQRPHLLESDALSRVQDIPGLAEELPAKRKAIIDDHLTGDQATLNSGRSWQIELADTVAEGRPRLILTTKTRIEHRGRQYVVGWYVPIKADIGEVSSRSQICLREEGHQVVYRLAREQPNRGLTVRIGRALLKE